MRSYHESNVVVVESCAGAVAQAGPNGPVDTKNQFEATSFTGRDDDGIDHAGDHARCRFFVLPLHPVAVLIALLRLIKRKREKTESLSERRPRPVADEGYGAELADRQRHIATIGHHNVLYLLRPGIAVDDQL
jgi:hypothetical protein